MWQYIALLGAVIIVAALLMPRKKDNKALPNDNIGKMELALEQFMENMEQDNKELAELVAEALKQANDRADLQARKIGELEAAVSELKQAGARQPSGESPSPVTLPVPQLAVRQETAATAASEDLSEGDGSYPNEDAVAETAPSIQSRYKELLELHRNGKSVEAIAKRLGMNKGEVLLILQLAKQEAASNG